MGIFTAGRYIASIDLVDVDELKRMGIRCVLFDRDNTCVPRSTKRAPGAVLEWFDRAHAAGLRTCMVSNNFHSTEVIRSARELKSEVIHHAMQYAAPWARWVWDQRKPSSSVTSSTPTSLPAILLAFAPSS